MNPEKKNDAEDPPPVLKDEASAQPEKAGSVVDVANMKKDAERLIGLSVAIPFVAVGCLSGIPLPVFLARFIFVLLILLSLLPSSWGCMYYAKSKGYSKWWGLAGIFSIVGLAVLWLLPDKLLDDPEARMPARKIWGLVCIWVTTCVFS